MAKTFTNTCTSTCTSTIKNRLTNLSAKLSTTTLTSAALLSDRDLLDATARVAGDERRTTAELLALLAELDTRKLYLGEGYSSLFTYCTQRLHLSESAAYCRITAARAARRFPTLFTRLATGDVTLTSISLLASHLTDDNHESLLDAARHASRRDVERLVASLHAQPDLPASVRRLSGASTTSEPPADRSKANGSTRAVGSGFESATRARLEPLLGNSDGTASSPLPPAPRQILGRQGSASPVRPNASLAGTASRPAVASLSADRYLLRVTIDASTHAKLERARNLLRHVIPSGDPAAIVARALTVLVEQLERRKTGKASHPERARSRSTVGRVANARSRTRTRSSTTRPLALDGSRRRRHVPAAVKRAVWSRDQGRCAFVGSSGRCSETGFLEYHHVVPFAAGGATDVANLELRCRTHNAYGALVWFGEEVRPGAKAHRGLVCQLCSNRVDGRAQNQSPQYTDEGMPAATTAGIP